MYRPTQQQQRVVTAPPQQAAAAAVAAPRLSNAEAQRLVQKLGLGGGGNTAAAETPQQIIDRVRREKRTLAAAAPSAAPTPKVQQSTSGSASDFIKNIERRLDQARRAKRESAAAAAEQAEVNKLMKERLMQEGNPMEQYLRQMVTQQHRVSQVMMQMTFIYTMKEAQGGLQLPPGFLEWCVTGLSCEPQCC